MAKRNATTEALPADYLATIARNTALGRIAQPQDVGDVVACLSSDRPKHRYRRQLNTTGLR